MDELPEEKTNPVPEEKQSVAAADTGRVLPIWPILGAVIAAGLLLYLAFTRHGGPQSVLYYIAIIGAAYSLGQCIKLAVAAHREARRPPL